MFHHWLFRFTLTILLIFLCLPIPLSHAQTDFATSYDLNYTITPSGITNVKQIVTLTNRKVDIYATKYSLTLSSHISQSISATDAYGPLPVEASDTATGSIITISLRNDVVGLYKSQSFTLTYSLPGIATKNGNILNVTIPKITQISALDKVSVTLTVPQSFGKPAFISPSPTTSNIVGQNRVYTFRNLQKGPDLIISAAFGEFQIFDFNLTYHLSNTNSSPSTYEIALPPDTLYQRVFYTSIQPSPQNITPDSDGNWMATYTLSPNEFLDVKAKGYVHTYALPQPLPRLNLNPRDYLSPTHEWNTGDVQIIQIANKLKTPRAIYRYVVDTLKYNYDRANQTNVRYGAVEILKNPAQAACQEFTDLFIALARAAGIPAREINGFGYTTNSHLRPLSLATDTLHAWPEYYDSSQETWIQVDPTWGNTTGGQNYFDKLDTDHIAFVIHGKDSNYPYPAGSYKTSPQQENDITVSLGELQPTTLDTVDVTFHLPLQLLPFLPLKGQIEIKNLSSHALYNLNPTISSSQIVSHSNPSDISILPPFGKVIFQTKFHLKNILSTHPPTLTLTIKNQSFTYTMPILNLVLSQTLLPSLSILSILLITQIIRKFKPKIKHV